MKKIMALFLSIIMVLSCVACSQQSQNANTMEPKASQVKAICELAVMECYYHNVAKYLEKDASGSFIWKKDKHFWVEYSGVVKLGIDASMVNFEVADTQITITLPAAKVLGCKVDSASLSSESFIVDKKSAKIEAQDEIKAFEEAQRKLEETASADKALLASAQQRVQALLEEYITNIGNVVGKQYTIKWVYLDSNGSSTESLNDEKLITPEITEPVA